MFQGDISKAGGNEVDGAVFGHSGLGHSDLLCLPAAPTGCAAQAGISEFGVRI
jgi:hypothetical protein